ncbi:hypothetical protein OMD49_27845 [Bacillus anthracis]|nr:hypothetical protein [Bacillus anthracis]
MLLTSTLVSSTALAQTDTVNKAPYIENKPYVANVDSNFIFSPIDFKISKTYTVGELIPINNDYGAVIGIFSDKPFEYNVILRNIKTNELRHDTATGYYIFNRYRAESDFPSLEDGTYQVILENLTGTEKKGQIGMYTYGSK